MKYPEVFNLLRETILIILIVIDINSPLLLAMQHHRFIHLL